MEETNKAGEKDRKRGKVEIETTVGRSGKGKWKPCAGTKLVSTSK